MSWRQLYPYGRRRQTQTLFNFPWDQLAVGVKPAAGVDTTLVFEVGQIIKPIWFEIDLVTSAAAATRDVGLAIDLTFPNKTITLWTTATQTAGTERVWTWVLDFPTVGTNTGAATNIYSFLPDLTIKTKVTFRTNSRNLDVGDQFAAPALIFQDLTP
jgi:hypothetical protein